MKSETIEDIDNFEPRQIKRNNKDTGYFLFLVESHTCPVCSKLMVNKPKEDYDKHTFPRYVMIQFEKQAKRAGLILTSDVYQTGSYICEDCAKAGRGGFTCSLCDKEHAVNEIHNSYGDCSDGDGDYSCKTCYGTVPAKEFDEFEKKMQEAHRWDYE